MQGPLFNNLLLLSMVLVFGLHQRTRPELWFRLWIMGWSFIFVAHGLWMVPASGPRTQSWQLFGGFAFALLGSQTFALSFFATRRNLRRSLFVGLGVFFPAVVAVWLDVFHPLPWYQLRPLLLALVLVANAGGLLAVWDGLSVELRPQRMAIVAVCGVLGVTLLGWLVFDPSQQVAQMLLCQQLCCAAVLYVKFFPRPGATAWLGAMGFAVWSCFYLMSSLLPAAGSPGKLALLYSVWDLPVYAVGLSMILKIFEDEREEHGKLAEGFHAMYEEFRKLLAEHPHPMWVYATASGRCLLANAAAVTTYGYSESELLAMRRHEMEAPPDRQSERVDSLIPQPSGGRRVRYRLRSGEPVWVNVYEHDMVFRGQQAQFVMARDVTDSLHYHQMLLYQANHDALTGLSNRTELDEQIGPCLEKAARSGESVLLLTMDIDHFKRINDTHGHLVGDECLKVVAQRLRRMIRQDDLLARTGGEEFTAVIRGQDDAVWAQKVVDKLLRGFDSPVRLSHGEVPLTISIGAAVFPHDGSEIGLLRQKSDDALYRAKREGRNRACFASAAGA